MKEVIVLTGPPGSGKSTWAKNYIKYELTDTFYISQDEQGKEDHKILFNTILKDGKFNIIVDRMGFSKEQRDRYLIPAKEAGYLTKIVSFYESRDVCFNRIINRQNHQTIKFGDVKTANKVLNFFFKNWEKPNLSEADMVQSIYPEKNKIDAIIVDQDGTLANIEHRLHFIQGSGKKDWKSFFNNIFGDKINEWCHSLIKSVHYGSKIQVVYCSGRSEEYKRQTKQWLMNNHLYYFCYDKDYLNNNIEHLYMRQRDDYRSDSVIKQNILDFELKTRFNIIYAIDDRPSVCRMWRNNGIICLQCNDKEF